MMKLEPVRLSKKACPVVAFTIAEVVISLAITSVAVSGMIAGYIFTAQRAEWSAYSLAAHSLAMQRVEQCRAAKWDPWAYPQVDLLVGSNFPPQMVILDIPTSGTNFVYATNITTISLFPSTPPYKMIRVDCIWPFLSRGLFTNTIVTYRAPDQ